MGRDQWNDLVELRDGAGELVALVNPEYVESMEPIRTNDLEGAPLRLPGSVVGYRVRMRGGSEYAAGARSCEPLLPMVRRDGAPQCEHPVDALAPRPHGCGWCADCGAWRTGGGVWVLPRRDEP